MLGDPEQIALGARVKVPGESFSGEEIELGFTDDTSDDMTAYERLLGDAMDGENLLFAREDGVEAAWRVVDDILEHHDKAYPYKPHTWGPPQAEGLVHDADGWHDPVL